MSVAKALTPRRFGYWTVLRISDRALNKRPGYVHCRCACGTKKDVYRRSLIIGLSTSCGCLKRNRVYVLAGHKVCPTCRRVLPLPAFGKRPERGRNAVRSKCKDCANVARKQARSSASSEDRERALEVARQWKRENRQRNNATKRAWEARNRDKVLACARKLQARWRATHRRLAVRRSLASRAKKAEVYKAYNRKWRKDNAARCRAKYKRYMAKKLNATPAWADESQIERVYQLCSRRNARKTRGVRWHVDHIVPLQSKRVCGLHVHVNRRVIPGALNISKGNRRWPGMWPDEA
jgi:hypothetical protein